MPTISMLFRKSVLFLSALLALFFLAGCGASNPICGSSRPKPLIGSLSPSTMDFAQVQQGAVLTVMGSQFVFFFCRCHQRADPEHHGCQQSGVASPHYDRFDLCSGSLERVCANSGRQLRGHWLRKRRQQQRTRIDHHLS